MKFFFYIFKTTNKPKKILPYYIYFWQLVFITLLGIFDSLYLAISHYRNYTDLGYQSFCAISQTLNCDTVSQSKYSIFLNIPIPIWGVLAHSFFLSILFFASPKNQDRKRMWTLLMFISIIFSIYCFILAGISTFLIHSYCVMCILGYGVCFLQVFYTWLIRKRFGSEKFFTALKIDILHFVGIQKISGFVIAVFLAVFMLIFFALPPYWELSPPKLTSNIPRGVTEDGHPWIGAENPYLVIIEFSDYLCFPCKKNYLHLRRIIEKYPDKIRLVHRHFPMDHRVNPIVKEPYHNGAGKLALVAIASMETGKFWEMNDVLFNVSRKKNKVNIKELSEYAGIEFEELKIGLKGSNIEIKLQKDIYAGIKLGLSGTPGFVINDKLYVGQIPGEVFRNYGIIGKKNSFMEKLLNDF